MLVVGYKSWIQTTMMVSGVDIDPDSYVFIANIRMNNLPNDGVVSHIIVSL